MQPWKMFVRSVSVVTLLTAGGFAAGQDVLPFTHTSGSTSPQVSVVDETAADSETPSVDPAATVDETDSTTTTTTEAPAVDAPSVDPVGDPAPTTPPVVEVPDEPTTTTTAPAPSTPAPDVSAAPPATPAENDAPVVCAAASEGQCGPADPAPAAAHTFDERVQRCRDWWNRLADRLAARNRPQWAERARRVAERCEAIVARWQEKHQGQAVKKQKGDHNCDGHQDNGWRNNPHKTPPAECPPSPAPAPAAQGKGRPATAPGHVKHRK
jgi:hypothetical protein